MHQAAHAALSWRLYDLRLRVHRRNLLPLRCSTAAAIQINFVIRPNLLRCVHSMCADVFVATKHGNWRHT